MRAAARATIVAVIASIAVLTGCSTGGTPPTPSPTPGSAQPVQLELREATVEETAQLGRMSWISGVVTWLTPGETIGITCQIMAAPTCIAPPASAVRVDEQTIDVTLTPPVDGPQPYRVQMVVIELDTPVQGHGMTLRVQGLDDIPEPVELPDPIQLRGPFTDQGVEVTPMSRDLLAQIDPGRVTDGVLVAWIDPGTSIGVVAEGPDGSGCMVDLLGAGAEGPFGLVVELGFHTADVVCVNDSPLQGWVIDISRHLERFAEYTDRPGLALTIMVDGPQESAQQLFDLGADGPLLVEP